MYIYKPTVTGVSHGFFISPYKGALNTYNINIRLTLFNVRREVEQCFLPPFIGYEVWHKVWFELISLLNINYFKTN